MLRKISKALLFVVLVPIVFLLWSFESEKPKMKYGLSMQQINAKVFAEKGLKGNGVKIGVIDIGFYNADTEPLLQHVFDENRVVEKKDFFRSEDSIFNKMTEMDWHGTTVLCHIAGLQNSEKQFGLATDAIYYLARTDHGDYDSRKEEKYFEEAIEWLDSMGVKLVNVSLGYSTGFNKPSENYSPYDMDGRTALVSRVAEKASIERDMIIVTSAGNEGDNVWKVVSAPADAPSVITVGATTLSGRKEKYSSVGPGFIEWRKPDISCYNSVGGTSFSASVVTGIIACILQVSPDINADQIKDVLTRSSHLYPYGNSFVGYGVPDARKIVQIMEDSSWNASNTRIVETSGQSISFTEKEFKEGVVIFHKKDKWEVIRQDTLQWQNKRILIERPSPIEGEKLVVDDKYNLKFHMETSVDTIRYSTVATINQVIESIGLIDTISIK